MGSEQGRLKGLGGPEAEHPKGPPLSDQCIPVPINARWAHSLEDVNGDNESKMKSRSRSESFH